MPTESLTAADAASLSGPDWLRERRLVAAERLADTELPTAEAEEWRYSRIGELDVGRYHLSRGATQPGIPSQVAGLLDAVDDWAGLLVARNGRVVALDLDPELAAQGVRFGPVSETDEDHEPPNALRSDHFELLNAAFSAEPLILGVPGGVVVDRPLVLVNWVDEAEVLVLPRLLVRVGDSGALDLLDVSASPDGIDSLSVPVVDLSLGHAARLRYCGIQVLGDSAWQIAGQSGVVGPEATLRSFNAAFGGEYARLRNDCRLVGRRATGEISAAYFGTGHQTLDFRTFQEHAAPDTTSVLLFKGALDDGARSIYTGTIRVKPEARGTNAVQTNRNLKLSPDAWAESVPNLVIENNDVRCSHASTVGPVDGEQGFYLESRGVPPEVAERLIVEGFFEEVLAGVPVTEAEALVRCKIAAALDGGVNR